MVRLVKRLVKGLGKRQGHHLGQARRSRVVRLVKRLAKSLVKRLVKSLVKRCGHHLGQACGSLVVRSGKF